MLDVHLLPSFHCAFPVYSNTKILDGGDKVHQSLHRFVSDQFIVQIHLNATRRNNSFVLFYLWLIYLDPCLASPSRFYLSHCRPLYSFQGYYHLLPLASLTVLPKPPPTPQGLWLENKPAVAQKAKRMHRKTGLNEFMLSQSGEESRGGGNKANVISALFTSP